MSLFASYAKIKRKTFWVLRFVEISQEGILVYRDRKEDKQNKAEYKLSNCKIKELTTSNGLIVQILHGDESLRIMAHTTQEHKKILQAMSQIKQKSEQKQEVIIQEQPRQQIQSLVIQQTKPTFQPDNELIRNQGDQIKVVASQLIKKYETSQLMLLSANNGIWIHRLEKIEKLANQQQQQSALLDTLAQEIQNVGLLMTIAIGSILFILLTILVYQLLSLVDNMTYTYSVLITINVILLPFLVKMAQKKKKQVILYNIQCKFTMNIDYNALVYVLTRMDVRKEWTPNLLLLDNDQNHITALYSDKQVEKFTQTIYHDEDSFYVIEHNQLKILRLFIIKFLFDEDLIEFKCLTENRNSEAIISLKSFLKLQSQNPKSILFEYLQQKTSTDQIVQSEILYKSPEQQRQGSLPVQQVQIEQLPQQSFASQSQIIQQPPQSPKPVQQYTPEVQKIFDVTIDAKKRLESVYPLSPQWQQQVDRGGFLIHTRFDEASGQTMSRGEGFIPYPIEDVFAIIEKVEKRGDYDSLFDSGYMLKRLDPDTGIVYQRFKTIKIVVKSRDFVFVSRVFREENRWIVIAKSVEVPELPQIKDSIRGELIIAGWILHKQDGGTRACFVTMVDPKGSIPTAIVASSAKEQGQCVEKVKNLLDKRNRK